MFKRSIKSLSILGNSRRFIKKTAKEKNTQNEDDLSQMLPPKIRQKRHKTPEAFYMANSKAADLIADALQPLITPRDTLLEFNPGIGLMTKKFADWKIFNNIILIEQNRLNKENLLNICKKADQKCTFKKADFINLWKIVYQDKIDDGTRVATLLEDVPKKSYTDEPNMVVFGAVGSYKFFKHLINSIVFQTSLFSYGRSEMYLVVPPAIYVQLTCSNEIGYMIYRASTMLFQIFFEYQFIAKLPREYFLPEQSEYKLKQRSKLHRVQSINPDALYLVKIVARKNLNDLCPMEDIQALWYFTKQNCVSRRNRVIPNLEKYVPGCGLRLILQSSDSPSPKKLFPSDTAKFLPKYSTSCVEMNNKTYFPNINIYTEFGDLSPSQLLTLFCQFRSWPEYKDSSFLASLENSLLKLESAVDGNVDGLAVVEEEDVSIQH